jgi:hypothetical protein
MKICKLQKKSFIRLTPDLCPREGLEPQSLLASAHAGPSRRRCCCTPGLENNFVRAHFILMLPFEMRAVLYGIRLFNYNRTQTLTLYLYEKERRGKRARCRRDRERERERECVRKGGWLWGEVASVVKMTVEENGPFGIRIGLKR